MSLTDFLLARIAEDERLSRIVERSSLGTSPTFRLIRECEAKRRIVEAHSCDDPDEEPHMRSDCDDCRQWWPCQTLRTLAAIYADHPDYREEWRP